MAKVTGDPDGIAALKALVADNKEYLRFLIGEAETNVESTAPFTSKAGKKFILKVARQTGGLEVSAAD